MFSKLFVLILVITCTIGASIPKGLIPTLDGRIVGGQDTTIEEFPHQVYLRKYGKYHCGGSIYSKNIIITAAHCVSGVERSSLIVVAGASRLSENGVRIRVKKIHIHSDWYIVGFGADIAILVLEQPLIFGDSIQPIPLLEDNVEIEAGTKCIVSGWGRLGENLPNPNVLQYVEVDVIDSYRCSMAYNSAITDSMLCAGTTYGGKDACQGDSGGPLIAYGKQIGIVSWGYGCAQPRHPGVYSKISFFHGWVRSIIKIYGYE